MVQVQDKSPKKKKKNWKTSFGIVVSGGVVALLEEVIVGIPTTRNLANLSIPTKLGIVALKGPKPVRTKRVAPHLLGLVASILHRIYMLPEFPIPLFRVLHHSQYQILSKLHYETHYSSSLLSNNLSPNIQNFHPWLLNFYSIYSNVILFNKK